MVSPVSRSFTSNPLQLARSVQAPQGDAKTNPLQSLDPKTEQSLEKVLSSLEQVLEELVKKLSGGNISSLGGSGDSSGGSAAPRVAGSSPRSGGGDSFSPSGASRAAPRGLPSLDGSSPAAGANASGIQVSDPRLQQALDKIATTPDGAKLIAAAKANGLSSISVNRGLNPDGGAGTQGETYYGNGPTRIEIADPNDPDLIQTLAHELGHAATTQDGDSQLEENTVDKLGDRIQSELTGQPSRFQLDQGAYSNLPQDNGILRDLRALGIQV